MDLPKRVAIGKVLTSHGWGGEMRVQPWTDYTERFYLLKEVWVNRGNKSAIRARVRRVRCQNNSILLSLEGVNSREEAALFRGAVLEVEPSEVYPLPEGSFYIFDLVGLHVYATRGKYLGRLVEVIKTGSNDVLVVRPGSGRDILLPALKSVVMKVDLAGRRMIVSLPAGLDE